MRFKAFGGSIQGHLFENPRTNTERNLYWILRVDFKPVRLRWRRWDSSLGCEWLVWPLRRIDDLGEMDLARALIPDEIECTVYLAEEHHWAAIRSLKLRPYGRDSLMLDAVVETGFRADGVKINDTIKVRCPLRFEGIAVIPENLSPSPRTPEEAEAALSQFIALDGLAPPRWEGFKYVFDRAAD